MSIYQNVNNVLICRAISSVIVAVLCFTLFVFMNDLFLLAACVFLSCKSIFELSFI
jgi:hypothetical protein